MNLYLAELVLKFLRMIFVAFISLFNFNLYHEKTVHLENTITNIDSFAVNTLVLPQETAPVKQITPVKPINQSKKVVTNKSNPVKKQNNNLKKTSTNKILTSEKPLVSLEEFKGKLTGYGPDCYGCSGRGNLACKTREKKTFNLIKDGIYYNDSEYGKVRILSAATAKFKCGTIIVVTKKGAEPFTAIVLDSGGDMRKAWNKGQVWMDLAYPSTAKVSSDKLTGKNITFNVQRWGW